MGSFLGLPAEDWSALAAWATFTVAAVAALVALRGVREARRLRLEQAQPYVVAYLEETGVPHFIDLVVKNLGATAATEVDVSLRPPAARALDREDGERSPVVPETISVLVPHQEWRTLFDTTDARAESDLPKRYEARVRFRDARRSELFEYDYVLDWNLMIYRASVVEYGVHDIGKAAREVSREIKRWRQGSGSRGLTVYVRDGEAAHRRRRRPSLRNFNSRLRNRLRPILGLPRVTDEGVAADVWWGEEGKARDRRRQRVARTSIGRRLQRLLG